MTFPTGYANFYHSDQVAIQPVRFQNPYGTGIAGNLVLPQNRHGKAKVAMTRQNKILTLLLALASPAAFACNPAEGSGRCGYLGADGIYNSRLDADASYQRLYNQNTYVEPAPYIPPPPPPTHHCTARAEGGELCADTRPGRIGSSYSTNAAGEFDDLMVESYPDGTPKIISTFNNGKREGKSTFFYPDGSIQSVMHYQNGELHGSVQHFHPNGTLRSDMTYCNGETCGEEHDYDEQGNLIRIIRFKESSGSTPTATPKACRKSAPAANPARRKNPGGKRSKRRSAIHGRPARLSLL